MPTMISETKRRDIQDAIRAGITVKAIRTLLSTSAGTVSKVKRAMGIPLRDTRPRRTRVQAVSSQPTAPPTAYTPQEYFEAIANGLRERDNENAALRYQVNELQTERRRLLADLSQCKMQMANWSGPVALPGRSLGGGG